MYNVIPSSKSKNQSSEHTSKKNSDLDVFYENILTFELLILVV